MASFSSSSDEVPLPIAMELQAMALSTSELEVIQWLQSIRNERYQQNFVAADIFSLDVVCEIDSTDDLQELGIPKFSAKALMKHIVELKTNGFTAPPLEGSAGAGKEDDDALKKGESKVEMSTTTTTTTGSSTGNPGGPQPKTKKELREWLREYDSGVKNHGEPNTWDVTLVTDMSCLFLNMKNFNAPIDQWNTSEVTKMNGMFIGAKSFNQAITMDTSQVTNMGYMFEGATSFNQPITMDTSKVINMGQMFCGARSFNQPIKMDTSKVTDMSNMFDGADAMTHPKPSL